MNRVRVLMIDDSEDDAELFATVFEQSGPAFEFAYTLDPDEGLAQLAAPGSTVQLVLLDVKLVGWNGKEVLSKIRHAPSTRHVPVIVMSSSDSPADVHDFYGLGANAYVQKPADLDGCRRLVRRLGEFWVETASLP